MSFNQFKLDDNDIGDVLAITEDDKNIFIDYAKRLIFSSFHEIPFETLSQLKWFLFQLKKEDREILTETIRRMKERNEKLREENRKRPREKQKTGEEMKRLEEENQKLTFKDFVLPPINKYDNENLFQMIVENEKHLFNERGKLFPKFKENRTTGVFELIETDEKISQRPDIKNQLISEYTEEFKCLFTSMIGTDEFIFSSLLRIGEGLKGEHQLIKEIITINQHQ